ncbi:EF-hand domain-containing protein [Streptomyces sp. NPDC050560]|uniref:EF-hand domain-containing protein n=1 Tax=Streptomyces sp. NPDC050560 TaxID=3365630 RepID=UPI00378F8CE1
MSNATATARLEKRFEKWDIDGNGILEARDFQEEAARIAQNIGRSGTPQAEALTAAFVGLYEHLAGRAGVQAGQGLSREQFLDVTGKLLFSDGEAGFNRALSPLVKALIGICDQDHDGKMDADEFRAWLVGVGLPTSNARELFGKVDADGNGHLSEEELLRVMREFHFGRLDAELLG